MKRTDKKRRRPAKDVERPQPKQRNGEPLDVHTLYYLEQLNVINNFFHN